MKTEIPFLIILKKGESILRKGEKTISFMDDVIGYQETEQDIVIKSWNGAKLESITIPKSKIKRAAVVTNEGIINIVDNGDTFCGNKISENDDEDHGLEVEDGNKNK